ncbi:hypothetical protein ACFL2F_05345, partial [Myxococcota bacterium]
MKKVLFCSLTILTVLSMGLLLLNCSDNGGGCKTNADCPDNQICNPITGDCGDCLPNCTGKCCGTDNCTGTCPDNCPTGFICNAQCNCEEAPECVTDAECLATECCQNQVCVAMSCGTLECGLDPVCQKDCGSCTAPETCSNGTCVGPCTTDADCGNDQCCVNSLCAAKACGALECGLDPVCGLECGPCVAPATCVNGICTTVECPSCPAGQDCVQVGADGSMGCVIPPNTVPPDNPTDCANTPCVGNYGCYCLDETCSTSQCIENCGTCPAGLDCLELWAGGPLGCLNSDGSLPPNPPFCDQNTPCMGNSGCYTDGTNNFCIDNCSSDYCDCTNGETKCSGDTVQTCNNLVWEDTTDCTASSQVCYNGACIAPAELGEFCEDTPCATGLACIGTADSAHSFCTPECDCTQGT